MIPNGLAKEAWLINNPALGSYMLWIFTRECFIKAKEPVHPSKVFCLFSFIYYSNTREVLSKTSLSSNLHSYISKFSTKKACATDIVLSIHSRVNEQKEKTLEALLTAFDSGLLLLDSETGMMTPNMEIKPMNRVELDDTTKELYDCSRKLGKWFADMDMEDITRTIKVVF
ncbi:MAG: DUF6521 family protein [Colwellia sp.]|nr:DUF6521 family protein [Colwellia sp.]